MAIWQSSINLDLVTERSRGTMVEHLGIEFIDLSDDSLTARMPVNECTKQPIGILHGGATCVLAETVGSTAANYCVDPSTHYCVGLDINVNHIRSIRSGYVIAVARPFHLGRSTQVWGIDVHDEKDQRIAVSRLTMSVLKR